MPVIPTYEPHEELDPDARGMPKAEVSQASAQAAGQQGRTIQALGGQIENTLDAFAQRAQQKQQEESTFTTGLQNRALSQDLEGAYQNGVNTIPANGTGFTQSFMDTADQLAQQRFDQMPAGQARDQAIQTWQQVGKQAWANRATEQEYKQKGIYSSQQIGQTQDTDLSTVQQNPAAADILFEQARSQIMNSPGLTTDQKMAALTDYQRNLYATELQTRFPNDPDGMRGALHMAVPGTPAATFTRMIDAESSGNPAAVSDKGALGLAQVMPDTARMVARDMGLPNVSGMSDSQLQSYFTQHPEVNRQIGQIYFNEMLQRYNGDQQAAVVAYNAGPARADAWLARGKDDDVLPKETIDYKNKVLGPDGSATHAITTSGGPLGSVGFDGSTATVNGKTFTAPVSPVQVARQFQGMDENTNRDTLSAFIAKSCGQKVDPSHIPWCASFADAVLGASGKQTLGSARAADFLNYGTPTNAPSQGDGVVFKSLAAGSSGHVGFVIGIEGDKVRYIAGNDGNMVDENTLPLSKVAGFRVPPAAGQASPDGGMFNGKYAALTFNDRQKLIAGAEAGQRRAVADQQQQNKLDTYNTGRLVDDDVASLQATGQGVANLDPNRVAAVLGPQKLQQWQDQRAQALDVYKGTAGMDALPNDQLEAHADQFAPGPQDAGEGYGRKAAVYQAVHDKAQAILKQRAEDPATAVDNVPSVVAARQVAASDTRPAAQEKLIDARIAAQAAVGVPPYARSPIPEAEAKQYAVRMRPLSQGQMEASQQSEVIDGIVSEIDAKYGRYARDVLNRVLVYTTMKREAADVLASAIRRSNTTSSGPLVTADEANRVVLEQEADNMARRSGAYASPYDAPAPVQAPLSMPAADDPVGGLLGTPSVTPARPATVDSPAALPGRVAASSPQADPSASGPASSSGGSGGGLKSFDQAVAVLNKNPDLLPQFIRRFGPSRVPANLRGRIAGGSR